MLHQTSNIKLDNNNNFVLNIRSKFEEVTQFTFPRKRYCDDKEFNHADTDTQL